MSSPSLKIRNFRVEDFESLYRMDQLCFEKGIAFSREEFAFYLRRRHCMVRIAELSGIMAGFILALPGKESIGHMITLDVNPEFRRMGVGQALMQDMHREFEKHGIEIAVLEVAIDNSGAQTLYKKLGYRQIETLIGYYRGKEDAFRMAVALNSGGQ